MPNGKSAGTEYRGGFFLEEERFHETRNRIDESMTPQKPYECEGFLSHENPLVKRKMKK
jgi:hypothetical protein